MIKKKVLWLFALILIIHLTACAQQFGSFGSTIISKPEEYTHVYEAKEKVILKAIAGILECSGGNVKVLSPGREGACRAFQNSGRTSARASKGLAAKRRTARGINLAAVLRASRMTTLRSPASNCGALPLRTRQASSPRLTSRT